MTEHELITDIMTAEGWPKFTNHPADRGGPTKGGITLATLSAWRRRPVTAADVEALQEAEVRDIYTHRYVRGPKFDQIADPALRLSVIDAGVLMGQPTAARLLQQAVGVTADGIIGPRTLAAVNARAANVIRLRFTAARVRANGATVQANANARAAGHPTKDQALFIAGWLDRAMKDIDDLADTLDRVKGGKA